MIVYRIARQRYARDLSGTGARLYGGRWNGKGVALLYTAESRALAAMELAVRMDVNDLPRDLMLISIGLPPQATLQQVDPFQGWDQHPAGAETQQRGNTFVTQGNDLLMRVPSVVIKGDYHILVNPQHPQFHQVNIEDVVPFFFDERLSSGPG
ncbi:MAG: RES family NAD+ phosphorylase [Cyclobacteriaceae bacterium]